MQASDCNTTSQRDVLVTYRRLMRRKGAHWFGACSQAVREELRNGANLNPEFVTRFTHGTRAMTDDGDIVMTDLGRSLLADIERGCVDPMPVTAMHKHDGTETACGLPYAPSGTERIAECARASCVECHRVTTVVTGAAS